MDNEDSSDRPGESNIFAGIFGWYGIHLITFVSVEVEELLNNFI